MRVLSATQAISPAVARTRDLLFRPFEWGTFLKLCAVAVFTEGASATLNTQHGESGPHLSAGQVIPHFNPAIVAGIIAIMLIVFAVSLVVFYFVTRLRFALFHCLVYQSRLIAPGWRRYSSQAARFFVFSIMVGVVFFVGVVAALLPFVPKFWRIYQASRAWGQFPTGELIGTFLQLVPVILLFALAGVCLDIVMRDFMLPHYALEDASAGQALLAVWARITGEPGPFLLYGLLRVVLPAAAIVALTAALFIPCLIIFGSLGLSIAGLHAAIENAAPAMAAVEWIFIALLGLAGAVFALFLWICVGGPLSVAIRNYALEFYGGRYQALGDLLSPPPAPNVLQPGNA